MDVALAVGRSFNIGTNTDNVSILVVMDVALAEKQIWINANKW